MHLCEFIVQCDSKLFEPVNLLDCLTIDGNGIHGSVVCFGVPLCYSFSAVDSYCYTTEWNERLSLNTVSHHRVIVIKNCKYGRVIRVLKVWGDGRRVSGLTTIRPLKHPNRWIFITGDFPSCLSKYSVIISVMRFIPNWDDHHLKKVTATLMKYISSKSMTHFLSILEVLNDKSRSLFF